MAHSTTQDVPLTALMSRNLICVTPMTPVSEALADARRDGVEHIFILGDGGHALAGLICRCDLERERPTRSIGTLVHSPVVTVEAWGTRQDAVDLMREYGVGCLLVVAGGLLLGVVTRSVMLRDGVEREELGGPCLACGLQHELAPPNGSTFCRECLECRGDQVALD